ncbi:MAG: SDR family oxidoreductase [Bacteroidales bacterium]|nr:SDR family oxidoreductase [Bacteroidales bacterium]
MKNNHFDLSGKIAVITGGAGVLGKSMSMGLLVHGAHVIIIGRTPEKIDATVKEFSEKGFPIEGFQADVLDEERLVEIRESIRTKHGKIDILVNAAGGHIHEAIQQPGQTIFDIQLKNIRKTIDLNLLGSVYPTLIFGPLMIREGNGSIINISSMAAERSVSRVMGYSLAKSAIESFTKWMSMELGAHTGDRIRINAIAPGFFISKQNQKILTNEDGSLTNRAEKIIEHTPAGRLGKPEELISTLVWLCSDESRFVTGAIVPVDGGFSKFSGV